MRALVSALVSSLVTFILFLPVSEFAFLNFDDDLYITENTWVRQGLTWEGVQWAFRDRSTGHWHPLTWMSHMTDVTLFGLDAGKHHLVNAGLHSINVGLLCLLVYRLTGTLGLALVVALLFGVHPMRIESVAWASQRKDVLSMCLALGAVHSYLSFVKSGRALYYLSSALFYLLALLAKPTVITLPLLFLVLDYWPLKRFGRRALTEKIPLLLVATLFGGMVVLAQSAGEGLRTLSEYSIEQRLTAASLGFIAYFGKLVLPSSYGVFYPFTSFPPGVGLGAFIGAVALSLCFFFQYRTRRSLVFAWLWFTVALLPMVGVVQIGGQLFADRWSYIPHIGMILGLACYVRDVFGSRYPKLLPLVGASLVLVWGVVTARNLPHWSSSELLFRHTLSVAPDNFMAHTNLGAALDQAGRLDEAGKHYEDALRLNPTYPEALNNVGSLRGRQARYAEARALFQRALDLRPTFTRARYNLGLTLSGLGDPLAALSEWVEVLTLEPGHPASLHSIQHVLNRTLTGGCEQIALLKTGTSQSQLSGRLIRWQITPESGALRGRLEEIARCMQR